MFAVQDHVIVYRSEREAMIDQWLWHGGGMTTIAWLAALFLMIVIAVGMIQHVQEKLKQKRRRERMKKQGW